MSYIAKLRSELEGGKVSLYVLTMLYLESLLSLFGDIDPNTQY